MDFYLTLPNASPHDDAAVPFQRLLQCENLNRRSQFNRTLLEAAFSLTLSALTLRAENKPNPLSVKGTVIPSLIGTLLAQTRK